MLDLLQRQFQARASTIWVAPDAAQAIAVIKRESHACAGLITAIELAGARNGWELGRLARELHPGIAIGYMSAGGHRDWVAYGVPDSVLVNRTIDVAEIAAAFLTFCEASRHASDHDGRVHYERNNLHALLMQAPGFIAFLEGADHRYTFANAAYRQLVERDVVGERVVDAFPEVVGQGFVDILDRIFASGEPFVGKGITIDFHLHDGTVKEALIDLNYYAMRDSAGDITGIFVSGEDATEHHRAQARIAVLQNELIHVSRVNAMGMMASTIAHELNQPLTMIANYMAVAKTIVERQSPDPLAIQALQGAADAALRAGDIIRNLKAMTARRDALREPVALEATLREAAALASLGQFDVRIGFDLFGDATVLGDKVQIQQVLMNLLQNALEAADRRPLVVTIATVDRGPFVEIAVSDDGPGIDPAVLASLFDSFVTTKAEGTGIGLSICKAIVEAHGGRIAVANGPMGGARFSFTLPQVRSAPPPPPPLAVVR
ncbi:hybrid sensor histidine kinase/response regulator [Sphingomonas sp. PB4P5]|uniref:hybrid sensor histidine kinase/response regulator n=1 Tax=Parasphingomonas puruogangriensis TaxID=3096155 RepID=UPI002FC75C4D